MTRLYPNRARALHQLARGKQRPTNAAVPSLTGAEFARNLQALGKAGVAFADVMRRQRERDARLAQTMMREFQKARATIRAAVPHLRPLLDAAAEPARAVTARP